MAYQACPNCGERVYGGYCTWCHEEKFIVDQYKAEGMKVPESLLDTVAEFEPIVETDERNTKE